MKQRNPPSGPFVNLPTFPGTILVEYTGAAATIDWSRGPNQRIVLTAAPVTVTSTGLPDNESASLTLEVVQDATGNRTIVFLDGDKATPFTLSTAGDAVDLVDLLWNGVGLLASIRGKGYA